MAVKMFPWCFTYKDGPAPHQGHVEARDKATAFSVAQVLCRRNGWRGPLGDVRPFILATEDILSEPMPGVAEDLPTAIEATTGVLAK